MNCLTKSQTKKHEGVRETLGGGDGAWIQGLKKAKAGFNFLRPGFRGRPPIRGEKWIATRWIKESTFIGEGDPAPGAKS